MTEYNSTPYGRYEDIFLSRRFNNVSIGNTLRIVSHDGLQQTIENVTVLNDFNNGVLRVKRHGTAGVAHSYGSRLEPLSDRIILNLKTKEFDSKRNHVVYFNGEQSVGVGQTPGLQSIKPLILELLSNSQSSSKTDSYTKSSI